MSFCIFFSQACDFYFLCSA